jgi:lipopolysaccharide transport system ATP-binding protein
MVHESRGDEVVLSANSVYKKFCRNLRRGMAYGIHDLVWNLVGANIDSTGLRRDEFWALHDVSFELRRGEAIGLIGVNGSGKTTLLRMIAGLFPPDKGEIAIKGRVGALISVGAGFHPHMTGRENIYLNGTILGMKRHEIDAAFDEIVDFAEIDDFLDSPLSIYSSGMRVRLGFSIATAIRPTILLLDEVLAVGDPGFRAKCFHRIGKILESAAVVYVSHAMPQVSRICDRVILLDRGVPLFIGSTEEGIEIYEEQVRESSSSTDLSRTILDPRINEFSCVVQTNVVPHGGILELQLSFSAESDLETGICLVAFSAVDSYHGQAEFSQAMEAIPRGESTVSLKMGPLYLRRDSYSISVTITGKSGKETRVHAIKCASFDVEGPRGFGVSYQVPVIKSESM